MRADLRNRLVPERTARRTASAGALWLLATIVALSGIAVHADERRGPNEVRVVDPEGQLSAHEASIRALLRDTLARIEEALPVGGVTITVTPDRAKAIGGWGVGGFTPDGSTVNLYVDPGVADLSRVLEERLPAMLAHEMHHARRWRGPGYGRTLFEAMVSEGLADRFAVELLGGPVPPWCEALSRDAMVTQLGAARAELDSKRYDHARWFFGSTASTARWTGYTIGYRIVTAWQARKPDDSAADLVDSRAKAFRRSLDSLTE